MVPRSPPPCCSTHSQLTPLLLSMLCAFHSEPVELSEPPHPHCPWVEGDPVLSQMPPLPSPRSRQPAQPTRQLDHGPKSSFSSQLLDALRVTGDPSPFSPHLLIRTWGLGEAEPSFKLPDLS